VDAFSSKIIQKENMNFSKITLFSKMFVLKN
jgi:hypothetical protein